MAHRSTLVGWTDSRKRRSRLLALVVTACGVAIVWAMFLPWAGLTIGTADPVCAIEGEAATLPMRSSSGEVVDVRAFGCVSSYHSVQRASVNDAPSYTATAPGGSLSMPNASAPQRDVAGQAQAQMAQAQALSAQMQVQSPHMAPVAEAKAGIPAEAFWALGVAVAVAAGLLLRNAAPFLLAALFTYFSYGAFVNHRAALTWGMEGFGREMYGVAAHQWAFVSLVAVTGVAAWLVLKGNHEQRKIDGKSHPAVAALNTVASFVLRINADRIAEMATAASNKNTDAETAKKA